MAAGKNAVSSILTDDGWEAVDADELVHEAIRQKTAEIIAAFSKEAEKAGVTLTKADGTLDRRDQTDFRMIVQKFFLQTQLCSPDRSQSYILK